MRTDVFYHLRHPDVEFIVKFRVGDSSTLTARVVDFDLTACDRVAAGDARPSMTGPVGLFLVLISFFSSENCRQLIVSNP